MDITAAHPVTGELRTGRVLLRRWRADDEPQMARINRHPEVGRYLNRPVDEPAVAAFHALMTGHWDRHGFGPWALESLEPASRGQFIGFAGLAFVPPFLAAPADFIASVIKPSLIFPGEGFISKPEWTAFARAA